jgi:hypothetical protein
MSAKTHRNAFQNVSFVLATLTLAASISSANGQSPIVFMTVELPTSLVRFDNGLQTFQVGPGGGEAFHGMTVHGGNVLVADYISNSIRRYTTDGNFLDNFALIAEPTFLESDSSGNVYTNPSVIGPPVTTRFNSAGVATQTFTHATMNENAGIDADASGNVYVADRTTLTTTSLFKFAPDGTFVNSTPIGTFRPRDMAIDEASNLLYLIDSGSAFGIKVFDISGPAPVLTGSIATLAGTSMEGIHFAEETGHILATDSGTLSGNPRGFELTQSGALLWTYQPASAGLAFDITTFVIPEPVSSTILIIGAVALLIQRGRRGR